MISISHSAVFSLVSFTIPIIVDCSSQDIKLLIHHFYNPRPFMQECGKNKGETEGRCELKCHMIKRFLPWLTL